MKEVDAIPCVVVGRSRPTQAWEFIVYTPTRSVAFRSAYLIQDQERNALGHRLYQAGVMLRSDFEAGTKRIQHPPEGFEELIKNEPLETYELSIPDPVPIKPVEAGPAVQAPPSSPTKSLIYTEPEL